MPQKNEGSQVITFRLSVSECKDLQSINPHISRNVLARSFVREAIERNKKAFKNKRKALTN